MKNNIMDCIEKHYIYKWLREGDKIAQERKAEKLRKKAEKKRIIDTYGYQYYLRDKTWKAIKNQKKRESFDLWRYRLALYGFTIDGFDTKYNQQHYAKPLVHEYRFGEQEDHKTGGFTNMSDIWDCILQSYSEKPRDVLTFGKRKYFYVYVSCDNVYIESGKEHHNASQLKSHALDKSNLESVYEAYKTGATLCEAKTHTYNSTYWFGIFEDLKI